MTAPPGRRGDGWVVNAAGRRVPTRIDGKTYRPFAGARATPGSGRRAAPRKRRGTPGADKLAGSIGEALERAGAADGWMLGLHHCLRNGEGVLLPALEAAREMGLKDLGIALTALFPCHEPVIEFIRDGTVGHIEGSMNGPVGEFVSRGGLPHAGVLRTHGGRARAVHAGELQIDIALIAASEADDQGNANGLNGPRAFGPLGYMDVDCRYGDHSVVVTDNLVPYPAIPPSIEEGYVDTVVEVESIGEAAGISYGSTVVTSDAGKLAMAQQAVQVLDDLGLLVDGFAFQTGAGTSLAAVKFISEIFEERGLVASFCMGGITKPIVEMLEGGTLATIIDTQSFDLEAVESLRRNVRHLEITTSHYADPHAAGCVIDHLDTVFLSATEVDVDFNVNVNTHSDGRLLHGTGGHSDTAAGAKVAIVIAPAVRGDNPIVRDTLTTVTTPGDTVDVLVTDRGVAVNPLRRDLVKGLAGSALPIRPIEEIRDEAYQEAGGPPEPPSVDTEDVVAVIEYRDGTILDVVHRLLDGRD